MRTINRVVKFGSIFTLGAVLIAYALLALPLAAQQSVGALSPAALTCEQIENPLGIDTQTPRLYWRVESGQPGQRQTAYQILVATDAEALTRDEGNLWDSGKVVSDETLHIAYGGVELRATQTAHWKVRVWDREDRASAWSEPASWTMGLLIDPRDGNNPNRRTDWAGEWIVAPHPGDGPLFRKPFLVKPGLKRALVMVCGLGQYELFLNGSKVGEDLLSPGWTNYYETCLYDTLDVTNRLKAGENAIGMALGDGMYHTERRNRFSKFQGTFGPKRAIAHIQLEYADGTVETFGTDESWRVAAGPVRFDDIYGGEDYDARREQPGWTEKGFDDADWDHAALLVRPAGTLRGINHAAEPLRVIETRAPVTVNTLSEAMQVVDFGQNTSYMPRITVSGPRGSAIRMTHAEVLHEDGTINRGTSGGNRGPAWWQYTKKSDEPETWFPQFFYVGCRYLQVDLIPAREDEALPKLEKIEGCIVHSVAEPAGEFAASNPLLGRIRDLVRWAQRSNMVSVLTDCPHREKLGWLEQYHLNGPGIRYEFDVNRIYTKGMNDMAEAQTGEGLIPNIAPEYTQFSGTFRAAAEWGSAFIIVPWQQYLFTGETNLMRTHWEAMEKYHAYLGSKAKDYILDEGLGDWYDVGPRKSGRPQHTPSEVTATAFYYHDAVLMAKMAALLGYEDKATTYTERAEAIRAAFREKFIEGKAPGVVATGSQCSNAMALVMDLVEPGEREAVLEALVADVRARGNSMTAGDVGFRYLLLALAGGGRSDVIYDMLVQEEELGYAYMLNAGATALTEAWNANTGASHNHFMLGHITEWFYNDLVGIAPDEEQPGFKHIVIRPTPVGDLTWAEGSYESLHGPIRVRWDREGAVFTLRASIPPNTRATVHMPGSGGERTTHAIESGEHTFTSTLN